MKVRKIKIIIWNEPNPTNPIKTVPVDTCIMIRNLVAGLPIEMIPRGIENFEIMRDLSNALTDAKNKEYLILPENVYSFLEKTCFPHIPARWGLMKEPAEAVILLIGAELTDILVE